MQRAAAIAGELWGFIAARFGGAACRKTPELSGATYG